MEGQVSIYEWLASIGGPSYPDINHIPEEEAARIVGEALGLVFHYNSQFRTWETHTGKMRLSLNYGNFNLPDNHERFLGAMWSLKTSGGGRPCSGIGEAIEWFSRKLREVKS